MAREGTARPDKQSVHKSSPRTLISDQRSLISNPAIVERRSVSSEKREWSRRSELGLLFADALIDGVLIVNQMRATHTIFHCTCTSIDRWSPDLYDNLSQHWHLHSCASWVTDWPAWLADWLLDRSRRVSAPGSATPEWCKPVTLTYVLVLSPIWRSLSLSLPLYGFGQFGIMQSGAGHLHVNRLTNVANFGPLTAMSTVINVSIFDSHLTAVSAA